MADPMCGGAAAAAAISDPQGLIRQLEQISKNLKFDTISQVRSIKINHDNPDILRKEPNLTAQTYRNLPAQQCPLQAKDFFSFTVVHAGNCFKCHDDAGKCSFFDLSDVHRMEHEEPDERVLRLQRGHAGAV